MRLERVVQNFKPGPDAATEIITEDLQIQEKKARGEGHISTWKIREGKKSNM